MRRIWFRNENCDLNDFEKLDMLFQDYGLIS